MYMLFHHLFLVLFLFYHLYLVTIHILMRCTILTFLLNYLDTTSQYLEKNYLCRCYTYSNSTTYSVKMIIFLFLNTHLRFSWSMKSIAAFQKFISLRLSILQLFFKVRVPTGPWEYVNWFI